MFKHPQRDCWRCEQTHTCSGLKLQRLGWRRHRGRRSLRTQVINAILRCPREAGAKGPPPRSPTRFRSAHPATRYVHFERAFHEVHRHWLGCVRRCEWCRAQPEQRSVAPWCADASGDRHPRFNGHLRWFAESCWNSGPSEPSGCGDDRRHSASTEMTASAWTGAGANAGAGKMTRKGTLLRAAMRPVVLVPILVACTIVGLALPSLVGYSPYGRQAINQQTEREDGTLCAKFGFSAGSRQASDCKIDLADLRRRHERLLLN
jgi:hypothetical protein